MVTYRRNFTNFVNLKCLILTYVFQDIFSQELKVGGFIMCVSISELCITV